MKKKMTLLEMFKNCFKLWDWLAKHPDLWKEDYFETRKIKNVPSNECYTCEYVFGKYGRLNCQRCPLLPVWKGKDSADTPCENNLESPYQIWKYLDTPEKYQDKTYSNAEAARMRKYYARKIADFCAKKIERLESIGKRS